ncbi:nuclear transport factor 2 family protein [Mesorhizobium sp.]|uniref:nuclear transport factor 2 family protein n=1 Tax=Mesorhizobium sp. TaxID=1871066 RepID=UPI000FE91102|nr:nuclear transport factor 2 family protein [Mesorhizobium sp.]RWB35151.1 MAG: nuclear transport factor 2 family protein [Mesorhizobium sp.]RWD48059.1 MAG: nuclear transport factor 2 family protein [Mesorhizobium sp.]TIT06113.1 MAG: nuclear transport factor 2 family protein [Mesorhizobium sp.]
MDKTLDRRSTAMELLENMFDVEMRFLRSDSDRVDMLAGAFHAEVVVHEPQSLPYAGDWNGLDGIGALFHKMQEIWSDVAVEGLQACQSDDTVYMSCTLRLTARANGAVVVQPFAEVLRFKEGRLIEGTPFYYDTAEIVTTLGSSVLAAETA